MNSELENLEWKSAYTDNEYLQFLNNKLDKNETEVAINNWTYGDNRKMNDLLEIERDALFQKVKYRLAVKNDSDVDDAVQHSMLEILISAKRGLVKQNISGLLYVIAKHKIYRMRGEKTESLYGTNGDGSEFNKRDG